jgi:hypothetical protein
MTKYIVKFSPNDPLKLMPPQAVLLESFTSFYFCEYPTSGLEMDPTLYEQKDQVLLE